MLAFIRQEVSRLFGYVASGFAATVAHYSLMVVLVQWAGWWPVAASSAGFLAGAAVKYPLNYWVVFRSSVNHAGALLRFFIGIAAGFALNALVLALLLVTIDVHYLVAQVLTTTLVALVNYVLARNWIFRSGGGGASRAAGSKRAGSGGRFG